MTPIDGVWTEMCKVPPFLDVGRVTGDEHLAVMGDWSFIFIA